jgi:hypothetical protein
MSKVRITFHEVRVSQQELSDEHFIKANQFFGVKSPLKLHKEDSYKFNVSDKDKQKFSNNEDWIAYEKKERKKKYDTYMSKTIKEYDYDYSAVVAHIPTLIKKLPWLRFTVDCVLPQIEIEV